MTIVTPDPARLDVVVTRGRDAAPAQAGGADRLLLGSFPGGSPGRGHHSPEPALLSTVARETDLPVWVVLRHDELPFHRLVALGATYLELGAAGLVFGFLDRDLEVDGASCAEMSRELGDAPWLFDGFDAALEQRTAWRDVRHLPGLDGVVTAGSTRGLEHGAEELIARLHADPDLARLVVAGGGLTPDLVPWLARAGVRRFAVGASAREGGSWTRASVDAERVRTWRMLLDDAVDLALGVPTG